MARRRRPMHVGPEATATLVAHLVVGGVDVLLAAALLFVGFQNALNRSLALALFLEGAGLLIADLPESTPDLFALGMLSRALTTGAAFAFAYFAVVYRDRYARGAWRRPALVVIALLALVVESLLLTGFIPLRGDAYAWATFFPFIAGLALASAALALDAVRAATAIRRQALLLGSLGLGLYPVGFALHFLIPGLMPADRSFAVACLLGLAPLGYAAWRLRSATGGDPAARRDVARYHIGLLVPAASVALLAIVTAFAPPVVSIVAMLAMMGAWGVLLALLIAFAVLRHEIFGVDVRLKASIRQGTLAGIFLFVFLLVGQLAQNVASESLGWAFGGVAAAGLLFALTPLQRFAERVADGALPGARDPAALDAAERRAVYREQARVAWDDGILTRDERRLLDVARERLGIPPDEAARIEREVTAS